MSRQPCQRWRLHRDSYRPAGEPIVEPEIYAAVVAYEQKAMARNDRMFATGMKRSIPDGVARWRKKNPLATVDEVLDKNYSRVLAEARKQLKEAAA